MSEKAMVVNAVRDADAGVWLVESSDIAGLHLEAETLEQLAERLPGAILDLLEASGEAVGGLDLPVELIARTRVHASAA